MTPALSDDQLRQLRRIDRLADEFEEAWDRGDRPPIESSLDRAEPADREPLLLSLMQLEWELRTREGGQSPTIEEYRRRFPEASHLVERLAVSTAPTVPSVPRPAIAVVYRRLREAGLVDAAPRDDTPVEVWLRELIDTGRITSFQARVAVGDIDVPLVFGTYVLMEPLGEGGMGQVFRARHLLMDRVVAVQFLDTSRHLDADSRKQFLKEIRASSRLNHPGTVASLDAGFWGDRPYLVLEFIDGANLQDYVRSQGPMEEQAALKLVRDVASAVAHAHAQGILHRDLKPSNIMRTPDGRVKLLDLGLARFVEQAGTDGHSTLTSSGAFAGTPDYASPEQAWSPDSVDQRSDIYSLGCTLYFLLTGSPPFRTGSAWLTMVAHREADRPDPSLTHEQISDATIRLLRRMMASEKERRPESMETLLREFDELLGVPPAGDVARLARRHLLNGLSVATVATLSVVVWYLGWRREPPIVATNPPVQTNSPSAPPPPRPLAIASDISSGIPTEALRQAPPGTLGRRFVWSETSSVYHEADCWAVERILPANRREGEIPPPGKTPHLCRPRTSADSDSPDTTPKRKTEPKTSESLTAPPEPTTSRPDFDLRTGLVSTDPIDLLAQVDPKRDAYVGAWSLSAGVLRNQEPQSRIVLPVFPGPSYDLEVRFTRISGNDSVAIALPVPTTICELNLSGFFGRAHGLQAIDRRAFDDNATTVSPGRLANNREYIVSVNVRPSADRKTVFINATLDGRPLTTWEGEVARLSPGAYPPDDRSRMTLGVSNGVVEFHSVRLWTR